MRFVRTAVVILLLAGGAGLAGAPTLAIVLSVAGLLLLDLILIGGLFGGLWRLLRRHRQD